MNKEQEQRERKAREAREFESRTIELILCVLEIAYEQEGVDGFTAQQGALLRALERVADHPEQRVAAMRHYLSTLSPEFMKRLEQPGQLLQLRGVSVHDAEAWLANPEVFERRVAMLMELPEDATRH